MENSKQLIHSFNHTPDTEGNFKGLTKREYFAGLAMQGLLSNSDSDIFNLGNGQKTDSAVNKAKMCVIFADELLKALESK